MRRPASVDAVLDLLAAPTGQAGRRGVLARGLGRSYGDAAQNAGGVVLDLDALRLADGQRLRIDASGTLTATAAVTIDEVLRTGVPLGWFPPVTPGTRAVTLGGALAADVHGKNHHVDGTISAFVDEIELVTPTDGVRRLRPGPRPGSPDAASTEDEDFWATVGGMGLTGVITEVTLRLKEVPSPWMLVDTVRAPSLEVLLDTVQQAEHTHDYVVAWVDCLAGGPSAGRGVLTAGTHAPASLAPPRAPSLPANERVVVPDFVPGVMLNRLTSRAFNEVWFRRARPAREVPTRIGTFFHPLDGIGSWNRLYGRDGLVQYQVVVPGPGSVEELLAEIRRSAVPVFLAVLKTFGSANPAPLSFPRPGWTLAVDIPARTPGLGGALDRLDAITLTAGGRTYLAKDARVRPEALAAMYPALPRWRATRDRLDPEHVLRSDLARRLLL